MLVVDACAIAALLFGEPDAEAIAERIGNTPLAAPGLLWYELASVCQKKIAAHPRQTAKLLDAFALVDSLQINAVAIDHHATIGLAKQRRLTVYDASYLWLARYLRVDIVTLDKQLLRAANALAD